MIYAIYILINKQWSDWHLIFCMAMFFGSLLPDIDIENSIAGYLIPLHLFFKHGGVTHTIAFSMIFMGPYIYSRHPFWLGLWYGYVFAHLLPDHWQGKKLRYLWWPFNTKKKRRRK
jgi:hypothetical protein